MSIEYFTSVLKWLIYGYTICLLLQQACILVGIRYFPLINLVRGSYYAINHLNTLAIEPSHAARLMTVFFYGFLKCTEYLKDSPMSIRQLYIQYRWVIISFVYFMLMIGSGTAIVGLAIVSLYFAKEICFFHIVCSSYFLYAVIIY